MATIWRLIRLQSCINPIAKMVYMKPPIMLKCNDMSPFSLKDKTSLSISRSFTSTGDLMSEELQNIFENSQETKKGQSTSPNVQGPPVPLESGEEIVTEEETQEMEKSKERKPIQGMDYKKPTLETSLAYMNSLAYKEVYGDKPIWTFYRRNFKGAFAPPKTRASCVKHDKIATGNPCPICRDQYLLLHHQHTELLRQFIDPLSGNVMDTNVIGLCRRQYQELLFQVEIARELGLLETNVPFRVYDYADIYGTRLPPSLPVIDPSSMVIPHAKVVKVTPAETMIEIPVVPNRYWMEEAHKTRRIRSKKKKIV